MDLVAWAACSVNGYDMKHWFGNAREVLCWWSAPVCHLYWPLWALPFWDALCYCQWQGDVQQRGHTVSCRGRGWYSQSYIFCRGERVYLRVGRWAHRSDHALNSHRSDGSPGSYSKTMKVPNTGEIFGWLLLNVI